MQTAPMETDVYMPSLESCYSMSVEELSDLVSRRLEEYLYVSRDVAGHSVETRDVDHLARLTSEYLSRDVPEHTTRSTPLSLGPAPTITRSTFLDMPSFGSVHGLQVNAEVLRSVSLSGDVPSRQLHCLWDQCRR